jgi:hypothetical protein
MLIEECKSCFMVIRMVPRSPRATTRISSPESTSVRNTMHKIIWIGMTSRRDSWMAHDSRPWIRWRKYSNFRKYPIAKCPCNPVWMFAVPRSVHAANMGVAQVISRLEYLRKLRSLWGTGNIPCLSCTVFSKVSYFASEWIGGGGKGRDW